MNWRYKRACALLLILSLALSLGAGISPAGRQRASAAGDGVFRDVKQKEIVQAMSPGWNLGNQLEANSGGKPVEDAWTHVKITERLIRTVKSNGFKSIRIPVSWLSLIGEGPEYKLDEKWLERVQEVVDWAVKYQLYVVVNIHGDGYSTVKGGWLLPEAGDQDAIKAKFGAFWKQFASRFKNYDHHLIFESMNEIGAKIAEMEDGDEKTAAISAAYKNINAYNQIFVDTVRKTGGNNDRRWLLIPGLNTDIDYTAKDYGFQLPTDSYRSKTIPSGEKRIMISVHYYSPWAFCGQQDYNTTQWGDEADKKKTVGYQQEAYMEDQFALLQEKFVKKGYPVVIGEWGCIDKTQTDKGDSENNAFRAYYAWRLCSLCVKNSCVPVYWDNGWNGEFGFGLIDRESYEVTQPEILEAILGCYFQESGTATAISLDKKVMELDLADSGQQLTATLTPSASTDSILWQSSDDTVARVSYKGRVIPAGLGTCIITATVPGGASAYCIVRVSRPKSFKAGLYANNSVDWNTLECDDYLTLDKNGGGTFTISLSASKEQLSKINTLFIKDVTMERGVSETSILKSGTFVVDSLKFNDYTCGMSQREFSFLQSETDKGPDICLINYWWAPTNFVEGLTKSESSQSFSFPQNSYREEGNTITMQLTLKDAELVDTSGQQEKKATALKLSPGSLTVGPGQTSRIKAAPTPSDATERVVWFSENPKVATVDKDGVVTGVAPGETVIRAMTISGAEQALKVRVTQTATPPQKEEDGKKEGLQRGSSFTAGALRYVVTATGAGKAAVAVKAPKNKKAKSISVPATVRTGGVTYKVTAIRDNAFKNCKKLKKLVIGKNVATIGKNAFRNAKALRRISIKSAVLKRVGKNACKGIHKKAVIRVPKKKLKKYKKLMRKKGQYKTVKITK